MAGGAPSSCSRLRANSAFDRRRTRAGMMVAGDSAAQAVSASVLEPPGPGAPEPLGKVAPSGPEISPLQALRHMASAVIVRLIVRMLAPKSDGGFEGKVLRHPSWRLGSRRGRRPSGWRCR